MLTYAIGWVRKTVVMALVLVIVACVEVRVVFHSLAHYIKLPPPWNIVAVVRTLLALLVSLQWYELYLLYSWDPH